MFAGMYEQIGKTCRIYLEKPKSWEDANALWILGHEVFHCVEGPHTKEYVDKHYK